MFRRVVRSHTKLGVAVVLSTPILSLQSNAYAEQRVHARGEALGRGVRLELWKAQHENVTVLDLEKKRPRKPIETLMLSFMVMMSSCVQVQKFIHDANGVLRSTLDLALTELPINEEAVVTTQRGYKIEGLTFEDDVKVCGISVAVKPETQKGLAQVLRTSLPYVAKLGEILVQEVAKGGNKVVSTILPEDLDGHEVLLLLPVFTSIAQIDKIVHLLMHQGVTEEKITLVTLVTCPEAADGFCKAFGDARLVTASFDLKLNNEGHIVPGIGSFEDRYLGIPSVDVELVDDPVSNEGDNESALKAKLTHKLISWIQKD
ncbi:unnamed protein product [Peronospora belbahrii]|uniref:Phosphoribosyltransferase domain-containing protein n=1 Tax=Peronospora belbahrii TaxID=622444 RepID=A0AAU9L998_9STRA|nr:unnamed protein product [Peronospora belbahrii]